MKKRLSEILVMYDIMNGASISEISDKDSAWLLVKANVAIRAARNKYAELRSEVMESMKPVDWDENVQRLINAENDEFDMPAEERAQLLRYRDEYTRKVEEMLQKEMVAEYDVDFQPVCEDVLFRLCTANGFDLMQSSLVLEFFS